MGEKNNLVLVVGAIAAFVLQIALAPAVALFSAQPNFLLAYALVVAIVIPTEAGPVLPFVMGLLYDLTGTGPVGGMALLLVIACFLASRVFSLMDNDTLFMPLAIFTACALLPCRQPSGGAVHPRPSVRAVRLRRGPGGLLRHGAAACRRRPGPRSAHAETAIGGRACSQLS